MKLTKEEIIASLKEMTMLEINDLVKGIEEEFGVSATVLQFSGESGKDTNNVTTTNNVNVMVVEHGPNKVAAIKVFREITGLGLMEAKKAIDGLPVTVKEDVKLEEAEELKKKFEEIGAKVEFK